MFRKVLRAKLHRATVTAANMDYVGSITIDRDLMDAVGLVEYEAVLVADLANGTRHETYVLPGERGGGEICVNGAAAHLVNVGDMVIIMCFGLVDERELPVHRPSIVIVDQNNRVLKRLS